MLQVDLRERAEYLTSLCLVNGVLLPSKTLALRKQLLVGISMLPYTADSTHFWLCEPILSCFRKKEARSVTFPTRNLYRCVGSL